MEKLKIETINQIIRGSTKKAAMKSSHEKQQIKMKEADNGY